MQSSVGHWVSICYFIPRTNTNVILIIRYRDIVYGENWYSLLENHVSGPAASSVFVLCLTKLFWAVKPARYHCTTPICIAILTAVGQMAFGKILDLTNFTGVLPFVPQRPGFHPSF